MRYPFEAPLSELEAELDSHVSALLSSLESEFLVLPKGEGFVEYPLFEGAYESLRRATTGFRDWSAESVMMSVLGNPLALIVLRAMLGFTPSEWAYLAAQRTGLQISQGFARGLDRRVRLDPTRSLPSTELTYSRVKALVDVACQLLEAVPPDAGVDAIHRLDKADTRGGAATMASVASLGVPYAMLLYERFLGRPFAGHRDSVSELVGDRLEASIEDILSEAGITYRKTKRAETIEGFDQVPDFVVPSEYNPQVVIEAKVAQDDGTARDKVTRVQHLSRISLERGTDGEHAFEVTACIAGRGFGQRREDMKKLLRATQGKVFTPRTLHRLVECTRLSEFRIR